VMLDGPVEGAKAIFNAQIIFMFTLIELTLAVVSCVQLDEEGKPINPHIPQFMASAPWYLNAEKPSLKHQKNWKGDSIDDDAWYDRGAKVFQATKYRKGACAKYVVFLIIIT